MCVSGWFVALFAVALKDRTWQLLSNNPKPSQRGLAYVSVQDRHESSCRCASKALGRTGGGGGATFVPKAFPTHLLHRLL